jgi:hypothetical protein
MTDEEAKLREQLTRATEAETELRLVGAAFDSLEAEYMTAWKGTAARDTDARERLWQAVQIVGKVRSHLKAAAAGKPMIEKQLAEISRFGERKKILGLV